MNAGQIKTKILIIRLVDWSLLITVFCMGGYSIFYAENPEIMGLAALFGLYLLNLLGKFSVTKIAGLRVDLDKLQR